jgi:hypothetical protein
VPHCVSAGQHTPSFLHATSVSPQGLLGLSCSTKRLPQVLATSGHSPCGTPPLHLSNPAALCPRSLLTSLPTSWHWFAAQLAHLHALLSKLAHSGLALVDWRRTHRCCCLLSFSSSAPAHPPPLLPRPSPPSSSRDNTLLRRSADAPGSLRANPVRAIGLPRSVCMTRAGPTDSSAVQSALAACTPQRMMTRGTSSRHKGALAVRKVQHPTA